MPRTFWLRKFRTMFVADRRRHVKTGPCGTCARRRSRVRSRSRHACPFRQLAASHAAWLASIFAVFASSPQPEADGLLSHYTGLAQPKCDENACSSGAGSRRDDTLPALGCPKFDSVQRIKSEPRFVSPVPSCPPFPDSFVQKRSSFV
jgi:hypothetical protein